MSEPESRKYARKVGCFLAPIWIPVYLVAAIAGMVLEVIYRGVKEGSERMGDFLGAIHSWDQK